ncbi:TetR/AcrR family transcriptional regulator [Sphingomonas populi]|uniref:TetR/AcrR family transcriptional regulator n=1 Tax=Sphingomonas populi TaxID=2484750 RepID=A0A4V2DD18_9SPHN|nr:TetR family transcriptional regulator [Sphingomonas populi]RZF63438.1 TetR/AcrR family transcriptional regulator [Sphingomonas populi]
MLDATITAPLPNSAERPPKRPKSLATGASKRAQCSQALERIIEASRLEFIAIGPAAAKIDTIAARANLTRQSVYYYYKNKEEIFYDIVIRETEMLVEQFDHLDLEGEKPDAAIYKLLLGLGENADQAPILSAFMVSQACLPGSDKKAKAIFTKMIHKIVGRVQILLDLGAEQGTIRQGVDAANFFAAACMITSGAKNNRQSLQMICDIDVNDEDRMTSWQFFAVDILMRSIRTNN